MKKDKYLTVAFLVIIFGIFLAIPCNFLLNKLGFISINHDNFTTYQKKTENNIVDKLNNKIGSIENSIENKFTNYFPFYNDLNEIYQNINFYGNSLIYDDIPVRTNSDGEYIFYNKKDEFYYLKGKYTHEELNDRLNIQLNFFNNLSDKVSLYIYLPTRYEFTTLANDNLNSYVADFVTGLNKNVHVKVMNIDSVDDYKNKFYKTDHHWNINGALNGYYDILDMFDITDNNTYKIVEKKERKYYGSLAKTALNDIIYDYISDINYNPTYKVIVNDTMPEEIFKPREIRLDRDYKYYDYYVSYFNGQYGKVVYDFNNASKENLLIVGDSYTWQIDYLLAQHFNKTHVINLRYDEFKDNVFDLSSYVKNNNISKVLFLYDGGSTLFDQYNYNFEGRVK